MKAAAPSDRVATISLILLGLALHLRGLTIGFPDQDLIHLDEVLRTSLVGLLRGGVLPDGFTPFSRELWLWWWGKTVGLGALGFHLIGAAVAAATGWGILRLASREPDPRAGWIAAGIALSFPALGAMLSSVMASRDLLAAGACVASLALFLRGRPILAGLFAGIAAASRETAVLLPFVLLALDLRMVPTDVRANRARRLAPAFLAVAAALAWIFSVAPWRIAPAPWTLPGAILSSWFPPGTRAGLGGAWRAAPWLLLLIVALSFFVVPRAGARRGGKRGAEPAPGGRTSLANEPTIAGIGLFLAGLLPLGFFAGPRTAESFAIAALGAALFLGGLLSRAPWWAAGAVIAVTALVSFGANNLISPGGPRFFTSHARLAAEAARTSPALSALRPWKNPLRANPRVYVPGIPPDSAYRLVFGPGARVTLHQPNLSIRFLAEMTAGDAEGPFGVLRYDPTREGFQFELGTAGVKARIGEGLLLYGRHDVAAACYGAAVKERPEDPELVYPWVLSLAAAGRAEEARARWREAIDRGIAPPADTLAAHLLVGLERARADSARASLLPLVRAVTADPAVAAPHLRLGRTLLDLGRARSAGIELSAGCGISKKSQDLVWLARAYDELGAKQEALETYRAALAGGLDSVTYRMARDRFAALMRASAGAGLRIGPG